MKIINITYATILLLLFLVECGPSMKQEVQVKESILTASRQEAASYHVLQLFADSSFVFTNAGMLKSRSYEGDYGIRADTIRLNYNGMEPKVIGQQFLFGTNELVAIDGTATLQIDSMVTNFRLP